MRNNYLDILRSIELNFSEEFTPYKNGTVISVGKSAAFMYRKYIEKYPEAENCQKLIILPFSSEPMDLTDVIYSSHPQITEHSFNAGEKLIRFLHNSGCKDVTVLISGGSSALIEQTDNKELAVTSNAGFLSSGKNIIDINRRRIENSIIKGGKLAKMFPKINFTVFSMSDIPYEDGEKLVGSMPFYSDDATNSKIIKCADCITLRDHLSSFFKLDSSNTVFINRFTESVSSLSEIIKGHLKSESLINLFICGEPTLSVKKSGVGGRMTHLALSLLPYIDNFTELYALSSDGIDGSSDSTGAVISGLKRKYTVNETLPYLESYNSAKFLEKEGYLLRSGYTGINLNDFVLIKKKPEDQA